MMSPFRFFTTVAKQLLVASVLVGIGLIVSPAGAAEIIAPTSFPDDVVPEGTTGYQVPIKVVGPISNVVGIDVNLEYNFGLSGTGSQVLTATNIVKGPNMPGWYSEYNVIPGEPDEIRVTLAGTTPLNVGAGEAVLFYIVFDAADATSPTASPINFTRTWLNEVTVDNNNAAAPQINLGGTTGTLIMLPDDIRPGQSVLITLTDADLAGQAVSLDVSTTGETQSVPLTEGDAGVFTGSIATVYGAANDVTGILEIQPGGTISATYVDALDEEGNAPNVPVSLDVIDNDNGTVSILNASPVAAGPLQIQVADGDLNNDPNVRETIQIKVYNQTTGQWVEITLTETGPNTGIFEFLLPIDGSPGSLPVNPGDQIVAVYDDTIGSNGTDPAPVRSVTPTSGSFGALTTPIDVGDTIDIEVTDADLAQGTRIDGAVGTIQVTVTSDAGDSQVITLDETSLGSGSFTGSVETTYDITLLSSDDANKLEVRVGDEITVTYNDRMGSGGASEDLDASTIIAVRGNNGTVVTSPSTVASGDAVNIEVTDIDLTGLGSITVDVQVRRPGADPIVFETEQVVLTETAPGVFTGQPAVGQLDVQGGDQIVVVYTDDTDDTFNSQTRLSINPSTGSITAVPSPMDVGDELSIEVTDTDLTGGTRITGSASITVTAATVNGGGDTQQVTLTETSSGVFTGSVPSVYDANNTAAGADVDKLELRPGYAVTVTFVDLQGDNDAQGSDVANVIVASGTDGAVAITNAALPIAVGEAITVKVTDDDLNNYTDAQETVTVTVKNVKTGETETVLLTEINNNSNEFTGFLNTGATDIGIGLMGVSAGDQFIAIYNDAIGAGDQPRPNVLSLTPHKADFTNMAGSIKVSFNLEIELTDDDMKTGNTGTSRVENAGSLVVTVATADGGGDTQQVTLTETGEGDGVFTASVETIYDANNTAAGADGTKLELRPGYAVTVTYQDPLGDDGSGIAVVKNITVAVGTTGTLVASKGVQDGDQLRIEVEDDDLDLDIGDLDHVTVTVSSSGDSDIIQLEETGNNTGIFRKAVPTSSGGPNTNDGTVQVVVADNGDGTYGAANNITVTYEDAVTADGSEATVQAGVTGVIWGDASMNSFRGALDASLILQRSVLSITFDDYQNVVGNVNNSSGDGQPDHLNGDQQIDITADDATLVLRKVVGLDPVPGSEVSTFPVQTQTSNNHPFKRTLDERMIALGEPALRGGLMSLSVVMDETEGLLSGQMRLKFDSQQYRIAGVVGTEATADYMVASNVIDDALLIAFAGAEGHSRGTGSILEIQLEVLGDGVAATPLTFEKVDLNGGRIQATSVESAAAFIQPQVYSLLQNWPNPFNPETSLRYSLPTDSQVTLTVFDMLGQKVRILVDQQQAAGTYSVQWNGRNEHGQSVASGLYLYRIEAGQFAQTRKMTLLR
jgi:hypothetical protein